MSVRAPDIFSVSRDMHALLSMLFCRGEVTIYLDPEDFERLVGSMHGKDYAAFVELTVRGGSRTSFLLNGITFRRRLRRA